MKKSSFQGLMSVWGGLAAAVLVNGLMFKSLHWPGGYYQLGIILPLMAAPLSLCLSAYVFKYGALKKYVEQGVKGAAHLLNIEGTAFIAIALVIIGAMFRFNYFPWGGQILLWSCLMLSFLCILAGIFACIFFNAKKD